MSLNSGTSIDKDDLPVENLIIPIKKGNMVFQTKALDPHWVENRTLSFYECPPKDGNKILGATELWKEKMTDYLEDVRWLLSMEHHKFWSTVTYHPQCMDMLVSFLQEANPPYMPPYEPDAQMLYQEIRKTVLVVFCRLITNKESKSQHMSKEYMQDLIYDKFIFTVPIVWDLCLVYGADNPQHVSRLLDSLFTLQPKYLTDLQAAILFVKEAFKYTTVQVNKDYESPEPPNLPDTFAGFTDIKRPSYILLEKETLTASALRDLVLHLLDTILTLRIFVTAYPKSVDIFRKTGFVLSIVRLYEFAIPHIYEKIEELECEAKTSKEIQSYLDMVRAELIEMFREILAAYKNSIFNGRCDVEKHVENYLSVMMEGLSENLFMKDYHASYPVDEDVQILRQVHANIDSVKTDFILQAVYANLDEPDKPKPITDQSNINNNLTNGNPEPTDNRPGPSKDNEIPDNIKEDSLITEVKDILPHLGDGFIQKCLRYYDFNTERVINGVLEDTLADSLRDLDKSLPIIPEDVLDKKYLETGIARLNVFDGDEFDIMTRDDVDVNRIHLGKRKPKYKDWKDLLDDKSDVRKRPDIYSKYNLVCDEDRMYSDEYDDTYDEEGGAVPAGDAGDDLGRPFVVPRALLKPQPRELAESSSEDEVEESTSQNRRIDFCSNPEEVRARRDALRSRNNRGPPPNRSTDVAGKPKGQGQEKEVLKNRDNKEKHKSARSNHSRRRGAQWKRTQGMIPS